MKYTINLKVLLILGVALFFRGCQLENSCPFPFTSTSESFVLGYRTQCDTLLIFSSSCQKGNNTLNFGSRLLDPVLNTNPIEFIKQPIHSADSIAFAISFTPKRGSEYYMEQGVIREDRVRIDEFSDKYGDTNFNRLISPYTSFVKGVRSGRLVLEEPVLNIKITSNQDFLDYVSGDDISSLFVLVYTDPVGVVEKHRSFNKIDAGGDYEFIEFTGDCHCDIPEIGYRFDESKGMYKVDLPAPFQWYDGEYFPSVIYQKLTEVPFAEIKHLSAIAALVPTVYPSEPCEVSFTIEVNFSNGKTLSSTTPILKFSGL